MHEPNAKLYKAIFKAAYGKPPNQWQVDMRINWLAAARISLKRQMNAKGQKPLKRKIVQEVQKLLDPQEHQKSSIHKGPDVDGMIREQYGLIRGESVWQDPVSGEVVRGGTGSSTFKAKCEDAARRSGLLPEGKIDWD